MAQTLWSYSDNRGVAHVGFVERTIDHSGTDVTYFFRDFHTDELSVLSGSRVKEAKVIR